MKSFCPCCESKKIKFLFKNKDRMFSDCKVFFIYKCLSCDLVFIGNDLSEEEISGYYPDNYYTVNKKLSKKRLNRLALFYINSDTFVRFFISKIFYILGTFPPIEVFGKGDVLDIGCGSGDLLDRMKSIGWKTFGYDIDPGSKDRISVNHNFISNLDNCTKKFDLIIITDVIEHVSDFKDLLRKINILLSDSGMLLITTPTMSIFFRIFGKYWYPLDTPRHLYIFNKNNLSSTLNNTGFCVVKIKKINFFSYFLDSINYVSNGKLSKVISVLNKIRIPVLLNIFTYSFFGFRGLGETLVIYAKIKKQNIAQN